jgi:hypothetical protein
MSSVLVMGVDSDPALIHFVAECMKHGVKPTTVNLRQVVATGGWDLRVPECLADRIWTGEREIRLAEVGSIYCRLIDLGSQTTDADEKAAWRGLTLSLRSWLCHTAKVVVNRPMSHYHNGAKPLHEAYLAGLGFDVPESFTSSDLSMLRTFISAGRCILKSNSGIRADAVEINSGDLDSYVPSQGPIHLQRFVEGYDVRVHVIGERAIGVRVDASNVDYRIAQKGRRLLGLTVPEEIQSAIVSATAAQGLAFAGWDFKVDSEGRYWCLECNPMPGYSFYDGYVDGMISDALLDYLTANGST